MEGLLLERGEDSMTFKDLQEANKQIQTTDIKGKQYAEVNQRIKAFRMCYPEGYIITELISNEDGVCVMSAEVGFYKDGHTYILGTGTAYERESSSYINKTSYIENCETSAVGRALGMAGFGIDTSVASFEEVSNAIAQQEANKKITQVHAKALANLLAEEGIPTQFVCDTYKVNVITDLTEAQHAQIAQNISRIKKSYESKA